MKIIEKLTPHGAVFITSNNGEKTRHMFFRIKIIFKCTLKLSQLRREMKIARQKIMLGSLGAATESNSAHTGSISICSRQTEELEGMAN